MGTQVPLFEVLHTVPRDRQRFGYRGMNGDIVALRDGSLLMAYTSGGIAARRSADGGRTWSSEQVLFPDPPGQGAYCHPSLLRLASGQLLIAYIYRADTTPYFGHTYYRRSLDDGGTWGDQLLVTPAAGYVIVHNAKLRQLASGRLVAPAEYKKNRPAAADHSDYAALVFYSDTEGHSWWPADNDIDVLPHECQEPHVVELRDGRLLLLFRTYSGCVGRAFSTDQGQSWSPGELLWDLPMSRCASAVTVDRIPTTGDLLLIRCTGEGGPDRRLRTPLTAAISQDNGTTWTRERPVAADADDDYGYQSVTFVGDLVLVSFHARDGLHLARIGVDWFYR
jgi:sialidase-1